MKNPIWITIYTFINALFVYKYAVMVTPHYLTVTVLYIVAILAYFLFFQFRGRSKEEDGDAGAARALLIGGLAIVLYVLMKQLDPSTIAVGRYPAMNQWIDRFLSGDFPYRAESRPSGLPFLFLLTIPFHIVGEPGLLNIISFLLFSTAVIRTIHPHRHICWIHRIMLLTSSPVFLYEIAARSDLFTNMVLVLLFIIALHRTNGKDVKPRFLLLLGIAGGCILATRVVIALIYLLVLINDSRKRGLNSVWLIVGILIGFAAITLPFLAWDGDYFLIKGPIAIQASYISLTIALPIILLTLILSLRPANFSNIISHSAILLFLTVLLPFARSINAFGWDSVIFDDKFDISYFAFCLPFLVLSFDLVEASNDPSTT